MYLYVVHTLPVGLLKAGAKEMSRGPFAPKLKIKHLLDFNFGAKGPLDISLAPVLLMYLEYEIKRKDHFFSF